MIVKRGRASFDDRTESAPLPFTDRWMGLPAAATWLAWFGRPYADLVRATVAPFIREERDGGLLVRMAGEPVDGEQLADRFPPLPLQLIARRKDKPPAWETGRRYERRRPRRNRLSASRDCAAPRPSAGWLRRHPAQRDIEPQHDPADGHHHDSQLRQRVEDRRRRFGNESQPIDAREGQ